MTEEIIALLKKAVWVGDAVIFGRVYMNSDELRKDLADGLFQTDCANFVNVANYLLRGETGLFAILPGVEKSANLRYCCGPVVEISNKLPFSERGQWVVLIGSEWWGMTKQGAEVRTLDEWVEYSRNSLALVAKIASHPVAEKFAAAQWSARSPYAMQDQPATPEMCNLISSVFKEISRGIKEMDFVIENIYRFNRSCKNFSTHHHIF